MPKVAFRPYAGDDREERIESSYVQCALLAATPAPERDAHHLGVKWRRQNIEHFP